LTDFDIVWQRIVALQGEMFRQKTGRSFSYAIRSGCVVPSTTTRQLPRSQFARAYERAPLRGPGQLQDLQGPSYLFAILADPRVSDVGGMTRPRLARLPGSAGPAGILAPKAGYANPPSLPPAGTPGQTGPPVSAAPDGRPGPRPGELLGLVVPRRALLVVTCSAAKARGGQPARAASQESWQEALAPARSRVLAASASDLNLVMPAWLRYTGTFYQHARPALAEAVTSGHVLIVSGGYGIARAIEPIGWYDKVLRLADWPTGVLESALLREAHRVGAETVVAFAAATTGYAQLLRRTPWRDGGITALLVTITGVAGGAMTEVPRRLAQAFSAFWNQQRDGYPPGTTVNRLS
jgi:hypothetical protein